MRKILILLALMIAIETAFSGCLVVDRDHWDHARREHHEDHDDYD